MFNDIPYVFGIADYILIAGFDAESRDHDKRLKQVLHRCRRANLKINKEKCLFSQMCIPIFGRVISRNGMSPDLAKVKAIMDMLSPKTKVTTAIL